MWKFTVYNVYFHMLKNVDMSVEFVCISVFKNITSVCVCTCGVRIWTRLGSMV